MKKLILLILLHIFFFTSIAQTNVIDSIKIIPENISVSDPVLFATFSEPFGGDCTYQLNIDSIIDTKIYVSGKFESDAKCKGQGANDTINIGLFPTGTYELIYNFIDIKRENDIVPNVPTETYSITFVVSQISKVQDIKIKEFYLYPNPCDSYFNIIFPDIDNEIKHIQLFDIFGKLIYEKYVNQNSLQINMSLYSQGIYFVKIVSNKSEYKCKIIKK
jgi:hypothetical protein